MLGMDLVYRRKQEMALSVSAVNRNKELQMRGLSYHNRSAIDQVTKGIDEFKP
jgi:hypothetical protein